MFKLNQCPFAGNTGMEEQSKCPRRKPSGKSRVRDSNEFHKVCSGWDEEKLLYIRKLKKQNTKSNLDWR